MIISGIHCYGWTKEEALKYWKDNIPNQDEIEEREVNSVSNRAGQALNYKVGADNIAKIRANWIQKHPHETVASFHREFLKMGTILLGVLGNNLN